MSAASDGFVGPEEKVWAGLAGAVSGGLTEALAELEEAAEGWLWGGFWDPGCGFAAAAHLKYETLSWRTLEPRAASQVPDHEAHLKGK